MTKVTGDLISIDDSAYDGFKGMTIYGKTVQNLWANPSGTKSGVTATANANGSFTFSGTSTASSVIYSGNIYTLKPNTAYVAFADKNISAASGSANLSVYECGEDDALITSHNFARSVSDVLRYVIFTTASNISYAKCTCWAAANSTVSGTYRVMLREATPEEIAKAASTPQTLPVYPDGSPDASDDELGIAPLDGVSTLADSDFDDYWCPPGLSSIDEVEVVTAGKNLVGLGTSAAYPYTRAGITCTKNDDGSYTLDGKLSGASVCEIPIIGNGYYVAAVKAPLGRYAVDSDSPDGIGFVLWFYDSVTNDLLHALHVSETVTIDNPNTKLAAYLRITTTEKLDDVTVHLQMRFTSASSEYEAPVDAVAATVPLSTHSLRSLPDGTRDELHIDAEGNCTLVKRVGKTVVDGTTNKFTKFYAEGYAGGDMGDASKSAYGILSDKLAIPDSRSDGVTAVPSRIQFAEVTPNNIICASVGTDLDSANEWMQSNNTTVLFPLATPQTIQLGKISLPKLRKKPLVNNIWANGTASGTGFALTPEIDFEYNPWSTYCDGFKTHGKHSYFDMGCCIAARDTGTPEKKSVTATVPYMSGFYDLSKLYGAIAFEARQLMYRFEFVEDSREELQQKKSQFLEWLSQVHDEEIADDDIPGRHFIGSLSEWEFEEGEEGQSGSLDVTFNCQPFLEADEDTTKTCKAGSNTVTVEGQAVNAYAKTSSGTATIRIGGVTQSVGTTEIRLSVQLQPGDNAVTVTGSPVVLRWKELTV